MFLQNERGLGVRNGTLGTIEPRFNDAVIPVARLIGRQMARDTFSGQAAANDYDAACSCER
jgi:hypothetical protein